MNSFRAHNTHYYIVLRICSTTISSCMRSSYWTLPSTEYFQCNIFANFVGENFFAASDKFFPHILSLVIYCCSFTIFQSASVFFLINLQSSLHFDGISYGKLFPLCDDCKKFCHFFQMPNFTFLQSNPQISLQFICICSLSRDQTNIHVNVIICAPGFFRQFSCFQVSSLYQVMLILLLDTERKESEALLS